MQKAAIAFPSVYEGIETEKLLEAYREGPGRVRRALEGLTLDQMRGQWVPGKWSILEIVAHMADSELVGAARMRMVYCGSPLPLPAYDQDVWANQMRYRDLDEDGLEHRLILLESLRSTFYPILAGCEEADWEKRGVHAEFGSLTLRQLLELYADHCERHIAQIFQRREILGSPAAFELLLPDRLY